MKNTRFLKESVHFYLDDEDNLFYSNGKFFTSEEDWNNDGDVYADTVMSIHGYNGTHGFMYPYELGAEYKEIDQKQAKDYILKSLDKSFKAKVENGNVVGWYDYYTNWRKPNYYEGTEQDRQQVIKKTLADILENMERQCKERKRFRGRNLVEGTMVDNIKLSGLKTVLDKFEDNGKYAKQGKWSIGRGGYDLWWQLYYDGTAVVDCVDGELENDCLSSEDFKRITDVICSVYDGLKVLKESDHMGNVIKSGTVQLKKPLVIEFFDEDDGMLRKRILPGKYDYRVLNVRGWKPRQLKVKGEWFDVQGSCPELEEILSAELAESKELKTLSSIKELPDGAKVRISNDSGDVNFNGDYVYKARKGRNAALVKVGSTDRMDELWVNSVVDHRLKDLFKQGIKIELLDDLTETTTVSSIAPTVDYLGHGTPVVPQIGYTDTYNDLADKILKQKKDTKEKDKDDQWASPLGRILTGESVRKVIGEAVSKDDLYENWEVLRKVEDLDDLKDYRGELQVIKFLPGDAHYNTTMLRLEDPKVNLYSKNVMGKQGPALMVDIIFDAYKDGWVDAMQDINKDLAKFEKNRKGLINYLFNLRDSMWVRQVAVYCGQG